MMIILLKWHLLSRPRKICQKKITLQMLPT